MFRKICNYVLCAFPSVTKVKKTYDHSNEDMLESALQFMLTEEVNKITVMTIEMHRLTSYDFGSGLSSSKCVIVTSCHFLFYFLFWLISVLENAIFLLVLKHDKAY